MKPHLSRATRYAQGALAVALVLAASTATAKLSILTLNGQLLSNGGVAVPDGSYTITVAFYAAQKDVKAVASEVIAIKTTAGAFTADLGVKTALPVKSLRSAGIGWMGVRVGGDPELARVPLAHGYAFRADVAGDVRCSGCITKSKIDASVFSPYALKSSLKFAKSSQSCSNGEVIKGSTQRARPFASPTPAQLTR